MAEEDGKPSNSNLPTPDPTRMTTALVDRALAAYRELVNAQIQNLETRLAGMDRATGLLAEELAKTEGSFSERIERQVRQIQKECEEANAALRESYTLQIRNVELQVKGVSDVNLEKFVAIDSRFVERDTRTEETAQQGRISLSAALDAAKEAVGEQNRSTALAIGKSEGATQKQIDAMTELMRTTNKALADQIAELKGRLDRGEGQEKGTTEIRQRNQIQSNWSIGLVVAVGLSVLGSVVGITLAILNHR